MVSMRMNITPLTTTKSPRRSRESVTKRTKSQNGTEDLSQQASRALLENPNICHAVHVVFLPASYFIVITSCPCRDFGKKGICRCCHGQTSSPDRQPALHRSDELAECVIVVDKRRLCISTIMCFTYLCMQEGKEETTQRLRMCESYVHRRILTIFSIVQLRQKGMPKRQCFQEPV